MVVRERLFPNAGWPSRFERLHGIGLFAAVSLVIVVFVGDGRRAGGQPSSSAAGGATNTAIG